MEMAASFCRDLQNEFLKLILHLAMYKPIFLGINNATSGGLLVIFGILIFMVVALIVLAGLMIYYTGYYIIKSIRPMRKNSMRK
jgi:hypothetical protein